MPGMNASQHPLPSIFVSHGSPMIALEPGAAGAFIERLGAAIDAAFGRPRAIVAVSAHTLARGNCVLAAPAHAAVYDFGGFPEALYRLRYDAPGDPPLAAQLSSLLAAAGIDAPGLPEGGLDHGIWTALRYLVPQADVPVVPLAMNPHATPAEQFALGQALAPLGGQGVLVLGTGSITHNLRRLVQARTLQATMGEAEAVAELPESAAFRAWMHERGSARDWPAWFDYRRRAPAAVDMHPSDEHLLPLFVAAGAGGREATPLRLYAGVTHGCLGMDAYAFGAQAGQLAAALVSA